MLIYSFFTGIILEHLIVNNSSYDIKLWLLASTQKSIGRQVSIPITHGKFRGQIGLVCILY